MKDDLLDRLMLNHDHSIDEKIMKFWNHKWNTSEIARILALKESDVANRLAKLRDAQRAAA